MIITLKQLMDEGVCSNVIEVINEVEVMKAQWVLNEIVTILGSICIGVSIISFFTSEYDLAQTLILYAILSRLQVAGKPA